jgi:uncharacterized protein
VLAAPLILSVFRVGWHLPLFLYGHIPWSHVLYIIASQMIISWLYNSTKGSVLIAMALHLSQNVSGAFFNPMFAGGDAATFGWLKGAIYFAVSTGVVVWAASAHRRIATAVAQKAT